MGRATWMSTHTPLALIVAFGTMACGGGHYAQPFTTGWTHDLKRFDDRKGKTAEGIQLTAKDSAVPTKVAVDEEGKPRLLIGGDAVSADVRVSSGDATAVAIIFWPGSTSTSGFDTTTKIFCENGLRMCSGGLGRVST